MNNQISTIYLKRDGHADKPFDKGKPALIKNVCSDWIALQKWNTSFFVENYGNTLCGCLKLENNIACKNEDNGSRLDYILLADALLTIDRKENHTYNVATPVEVFGNRLSSDYNTPAFLTQKHFLRKRLFISPESAITTLHNDLFNNLYVVVKGKKRVMLYPPLSPVYRNSPFSKLPNHTRVDPLHPDFNSYPKFAEAKSIIVEVGAGDSLYIPPLWWHHLVSVETTIAISFWWAEGLMIPITAFAAFYKTLRKI